MVDRTVRPERNFLPSPAAPGGVRVIGHGTLPVRLTLRGVLHRCGSSLCFPLPLPLKTSAGGDPARHADPVELRSPAFGPRPVEHRPTDLLRLAELLNC